MTRHEPLKNYLHKIKKVRTLTCADGLEVKRHLKNQFTEGMYWSNYGLRHQGWNIDHIVAVSSLKKSINKNGRVNEKMLDKIEICNLSNLHLMRKNENSSKGGI